MTLFKMTNEISWHDDVIKWKHFPRYWPFVRGIQRFPVNSPHKGQWRGALMFSLICVWINAWVNNREAGDLRRHRAYYDVTVMRYWEIKQSVRFVLGDLHWSHFVWGPSYQRLCTHIWKWMNDKCCCISITLAHQIDTNFAHNVACCGFMYKIL